jgi:hypothetical protein
MCYYFHDIECIASIHVENFWLWRAGSVILICLENQNLHFIYLIKLILQTDVALVQNCSE